MAGSLTEERLALLLRDLPPAPNGWVLAAGAHPDARRALDQLDVRGLDTQTPAADDPWRIPDAPDLEGGMLGRDADVS